jgi:hypothetical protein
MGQGGVYLTVQCVTPTLVLDLSDFYIPGAKCEKCPAGERRLQQARQVRFIVVGFNSVSAILIRSTEEAMRGGASHSC